MTFQEDLFSLGYKQAKSHLPLVFIQNPNIERLKSEDRLKALELATETKNTLYNLLSEAGIDKTEKNIRDMLISNMECLVTLNVNGEDLNTISKVYDTAFSNSKLTTKDSNYLQHLSRASVQTSYATLNQDRLAKYHAKSKQEELPNRLLNAINKNSQELYKSQESDSLINDNEVRYLKVDLNSGKVTNMQKEREFVNFVPVQQAQGYLIGLYELMKSELLEVEYFRTDFKKRTQFISKKDSVIRDIYNNTEVTSIISNSESPLNPIIEGLKLTKDASDGWLTAPDLGYNITSVLESGVSNILRKITLTNIMSLKQITEEQYPKVVSDLSLMVEYNLKDVPVIFESNINSADEKQLQEIVNVYNNTEGVLHIESDTGIASFNLIDSCNMTVLSYSTTGSRAILKMMLSYPNLFKVPKQNSELVVAESKPKEYSGNLADLINFG